MMDRRRRVLLLIAFAFLLLLAPSSATSQAKNILTVGTIPEFTTIDPNNLQSIESPVHKALFDALVIVDPRTLQPQPWLAESWQFAPDAKSLTLKLRRGVRFQNGRELKAGDVVKNLERALNKETGLSIYGSFGMVQKGEALDDYTVRFLFSQPTPGFMGRLFTWHIIAPESFSAAGKRPIGTGPYRLVEWVPQERMVIEKFPGYWFKGQNNIDQVVYRFFSDPESMAIAAEAGQLDVVQYAQVKDIERLRRSGFRIAGIGGGPSMVPFDYLILWLNPSRPALANVNIRQAIARSIDRDTVVRGILFGASYPTTLPVPRQSPAYDAVLDREWAYNLDEAKNLVQQSGIKNPEFTVVTTSAFPELAQTTELLQADLAKIGVNMKIESVDGNTHSSRGVKGDYEALFWFASAGLVDPADFEDNSGYRIRTGILWQGTVPQDYREAFQKASATLDPKSRAEAFRAVWRILHQRAWAIPIAWRPLIYANKPTVRNVMYDPLGRLFFHDLVKSK